MNRRFPALVMGLLLVAVAFSAVAMAAAPAAAADRDVNQQLSRVRKATAKYQNVRAAIADGYVPTEHCLAAPGLGTMGYHYVNPALAADAELDPLKPEVLLYVPSSSGGVRLVAVEYFIASAAVSAHPSLFGQPFDGPMAGHEPGMPEHYDLHAWIWANNPGGVFAQFNPSVSCGS